MEILIYVLAVSILLAVVINKFRLARKDKFINKKEKTRIVDNRGITIGYMGFTDGFIRLYDTEEKEFMVNPKGNITKIFQKRISEKHLEKLTKLRYGIKGK